MSLPARDPRTPRSDSVLEPDVDADVRARPVEPGAPVPDLARTERAIERPAARSLAITVLAVLAVLYSMYFAREFLIPVAFALLLNFLLSPVVRALARARIRPPIGAALIVLGLVGILGGGAFALAGPAQRWIAAAPQSLRNAEGKLARIFRPVKVVQKTAEEVQKAAGAISSTTPRGAAGAQPAVVVHEGPTLAARIFGTTERIVIGTLEILFLLYFMLAGGDLFLQKLIKVLPRDDQKEQAVDIARASESAVSAYLGTMLLVSIAEGIVVAIILWLLGMPNAPLWGAMVALLEFVPYLGGAVATVVLTLAGLTTFDTIGHALLVPGSYALVNLVQSNIVTPLLQGHRLTLNPVAVFLGLAFFWFVWGIPGAFLAVPLLATFKITCDHIPALAAVGEFLGERDESERRMVVRDD